MNFEQRLTVLFQDAIDVKDTIWSTENETLFDAIMRIYHEELDIV